MYGNLLKVKYGTTMSYLQLSHQMNNPLAIRAIAAANGRNNLWIVVPCHRIIGSDGALQVMQEACGAKNGYLIMKPG